MLGTYYADKFVGRHTSNGEIFRQNQYTAAHRSLPFGTFLLVTYPKTSLSIVVKVNDRCPKANVLDMTKIAIHSIGIKGSANVAVQVLNPEVGQMMWANQDTTWMTREDYLTFRDRSKTRRITPYGLGNSSGKDAPARQVSQSQSTKPRSNPESASKQEMLEAKKIDEYQQDTVVVEVDPSAPKYDIELCVVGSLNAANLETNRLPAELRKKVILEQNKHSREVKIILALGNSRSHAVRTQAMLIDVFPDSFVVLRK